MTLVSEYTGVPVARIRDTSRHGPRINGSCVNTHARILVASLYRRRGLTYPEIAEAMGLNTSTVYRCVMAGVAYPADLEALEAMQ